MNASHHKDSIDVTALIIQFNPTVTLVDASTTVNHRIHLQKWTQLSPVHCHLKHGRSVRISRVDIVFREPSLSYIHVETINYRRHDLINEIQLFINSHGLALDTG